MSKRPGGTAEPEVRVSVATPVQEAALIELAREVEPLFGPMADDAGFRSALADAVRRGDVLCIGDGRDGVSGAVILDLAENGIAWLAVTAAVRGRGIGRRLVTAAIDRLAAEQEVVVQTFAAGVAEGEAARRLYLALGFGDRADAGANPAGIPTVMMVRPAAKPVSGA